MQEHPFAAFIRIIGKGQKGSRNLTQAEAEQAFAMLLDKAVEPVQLGAFLMLLRYQEESAEELAGFTQAIRQRVRAPAIKVDLDWPSYAGKRRQLPYYLLAAKLLAQNGISILLHGAGAHTEGRLYTEDLLDLIGIRDCQNWQQVHTAIEQDNIAFIGLEQFLPALQEIINLRPLLGLRSPVHSLARMINPLNARCSLQSIFHPNYLPIHQTANQLLGDTAIVIKGDGGEVEIRPEANTLLFATDNGQAWQEEWPRTIERQVKPESLQAERLLDLWQGKLDDVYGTQAVLLTCAFALRALGYSQAQALATAEQWWQAR